jgi:serine acetyltransferase
VVVGTGSIIAAGALVNTWYPYSIVAGVPASDQVKANKSKNSNTLKPLNYYHSSTKKRFTWPDLVVCLEKLSTAYLKTILK